MCSLLPGFVRSLYILELDPTTGTGRAEIYDLPLFGSGVQEKKDGQGDRPSSFLMVAGARYVVLKKIPGRRIKFECSEGLCSIATSKPVLLAAA